MSFLGKANFCTNGHSQLQRLCHVIQSDMLSVYHSPTQLFSHVHFSLSSLHQLEWLAKLQQSPVPLHLPLPDVIIATDATPTQWAFYFQGSGLPLSVSGAWSGALSKAHIALQNFRLLPSCSIGCPSTSLVRLLPCIWITVLLRHTCLIKVVQCLLSFQTGLPDTESDRQAWYYSSSSIHSYPPQCAGRFFAPGSDASRVAPFSSGGFGSFSPLGPSRGGPPGIFSFYSMPTLFHFGNSTACGCLGVECLQISLEISGKLCVSSSSSGPSCSIQVSSKT